MSENNPRIVYAVTRGIDFLFNENTVINDVREVAVQEFMAANSGGDFYVVELEIKTAQRCIARRVAQPVEEIDPTQVNVA